MQKSISIAIGASTLLALGLTFWVSRPRKQIVHARKAPVSSTPVRASSHPAALRVAPAVSNRSERREPTEPYLTPRGRKLPGFLLPDGGLAPELPSDAAASRRFGVVLVRYRGAQGAGHDARSKSKALEYARSLLPLAQTDFRAALKFGDPGSSADLGTVPKNVLEPAPNYVLFTAKPGDVVGPIDTPTGFWIAKIIR